MPLLDVTMHFDNSVLAANDTVGTRSTTSMRRRSCQFYSGSLGRRQCIKDEGDLLAAR